ncbi:MAG: YdbH domain-containing protein [Candidatus Tectimicrobiota bacterium]
MHRHRRFWIILLTGVLATPLVFYALLPPVAAVSLRYLLAQQGYTQVSLRLGYPGWHSLDIPYAHVERPLGHEWLSVTVERARLQYDLRSVLAGRVHQLTLGSVNVTLRGRGSDPARPCQGAAPALTQPGLAAPLTVGQTLQRLPALPWHRLVLEQGQVWRECASGPLQHLRLAGTLQQQETAFEARVTLQGQTGAAYRLQVSGTPAQRWQLSLAPEAASAPPIVKLQTQVQRRAAQVELRGSGELDVTRLLPLLQLLIPGESPVPAVAGTLHAQWQGTAPASAPLATVWHHPALSMTGTASLSVQLPAAFAREKKPCVLAMQGEVQGNAVASTYRLGGQVQACAFAPVAAQHVGWQVQGTLAMDQQHIWGTLGQDTSVALSALQLGAVTLPAGGVRLREPVTFRAHRDSGAWAVGPAWLDVQETRLSWQDSAALITQAVVHLEALHGDAAGWRLLGALTLSGRYADIDLQGLEVRGTLQRVGQTVSLPEPARLRIMAVNAGVQVTDLALTVQPAWVPETGLAWVELREAQAALLGGYLRSPGLRYRPGQAAQTLLIQVEQLDVQQLLQLEQQPHLEGTGQLDGVLPVLLTSSGVQIQDGRLSARPPGGVIRYHAEAETAATQAAAAQLGVVLQALANLHYQTLNLGVHYSEDGTLRLRAEVEGYNPDWQQGRAIHLNLNLQENIPALLRSLQLLQGDAVEQSIQKHLQREEEKAPDTTRKAIR